jgi:phage tail-like protein
VANPANDTVRAPFTAFNFAVEIRVPGVSDRLCNAAFAECDGLEMSMEPKTLREGGNNARQIRLAGPISFGTLTLKRGMTASYDLWDWFGAVMVDARLRADATVVVLAANGQAENARFVLIRCLPVKLKAPPLNAKDGMVAIEELQLAYESLRFQRPDGGGAGSVVAASVSVSASAGASASIRIG